MSEVLRLAAWYGDHMVLQQRVRSRIYGKTLAGAEVRLTLERFPQDRRKKADDDQRYGLIFQEHDFAETDGFFEFKLPFIEASFDSFRLTIESCGDKRVFKDLLFGELWFTAGGSNMSMPSRYSDCSRDKLAPEEHNFIRYFAFPESGLATGENLYRYEATSDIPEGRWYLGNSQKRAEVSAIACSFSRRLFKELNCPIAIIDAAADDSMIHAWLPRQITEKDAVLNNHLKEIKHYRDAQSWNALPEGERREERSIRRPIVQKDLAAEPREFLRRNQAGALFNHKIAPFTGMAIRGILWAQGEQDVQYPSHYQRAFRRLANVFKSVFQAPITGLSLIYSQLPPFLASAADQHRLADFNEVLAVVRRRLSIPAALVTVYDLPPDYAGARGKFERPETPIAKRAVGERMAAVALGLAYKHDLPNSAPEVASAEAVGSKLILSFENIGRGLSLKDGESEVKGFAVAGADAVLIPAEAKDLYGVRVLLWHDEIAEPLACSYAYQNFNHAANLCSLEGMPVVPFRLARELEDRSKVWAWTYCDALSEFKYLSDDPRIERLPDLARPAEQPLWKVYSGRGEFALEKDNKRHGKASIFLAYRRADERPVSFGPILDYASDYPPLDLSLWRRLTVSVFSADHRAKYLALRLKDTNGREYLFPKETLSDALSWQEISFDLSQATVDRMRLSELQFVIQDPGESGGLTLDRVSFSDLNLSEYEED
ncbi:MAG: hypothetical protein Q4P08_01110 [Eubacteriales bacterium]|nr:hypothetical protein [Eubacteriales bacterium]